MRVSPGGEGSPATWLTPAVISHAYCVDETQGLRLRGPQNGDARDLRAAGNSEGAAVRSARERRGPHVSTARRRPDRPFDGVPSTEVPAALPYVRWARQMRVLYYVEINAAVTEPTRGMRGTFGGWARGP